jgi:hypothetical protein
MRRTILLAATVASMGMSGLAAAQSGGAHIDATPYNFTFRGGVVFPLDSGFRDVSNLWLGLGLDYLFPTQLVRGGSQTFLSGDWMLRGTSGAKGDVIGVAINQRFYSAGRGMANPNYRNYFFVGLGAAFMNFTSSSTQLLGRGGFGTELGPNVIAEATLTLTGKDPGSGIRANALGVYLGYRF